MARTRRTRSRAVTRQALKKMLQAKKAELLTKIREEMASHREADAETDRKKGGLSITDRLPLVTDEEIGYAVVGRRAEMLAQIDLALKKMDEGTYGRCEACEGEIALARLKAHPFAVRCTACQEAWERERERGVSAGEGASPPELEEP